MEQLPDSRGRPSAPSALLCPRSRRTGRVESLRDPLQALTARTELEHLPHHRAFRLVDPPSDVVSLTGLDHDATPLTPVPEVNLADDSLDDRERVIAALEQAGWVQAKAARLLGMTPRQIAYRVQTLNIHMRKI